MALRPVITSTDFESLSDELKAEYKLQSDGSYHLDLGGMFVTDKDPANLMTALEKEREETKKAKAAADRLEQEKLEAERNGMKSIEEVRESFKKELEERDAKIKAEQKAAEKALKEQQAAAAETAKQRKLADLAGQLFGADAALMMPHLEQRIRVTPGENPTVEVLDNIGGNPLPEQSFEKIRENLLTHSLFADRVVVSNASGGSANGGKQGSSTLPSATKDDGKAKTYNDYTPAELHAIKREKPDLFQTLKSQRS